MQRLLWLLVIGGSAARLLDVFCFNPLDHLTSDPLRHWINGKHFLSPDYMGGYDAIGYQVYMCLMQFITGEHRYAIALATGLLSVAMPWTYYRAAREFGLSVNRSLLLWALIVWMPSLFLVYQFFMMETLLLPMIGLSLWMTGRHLRKGTLTSFLIATAAWTLTCLTKTIPAPLAAVCLGYGWWKATAQVSPDPPPAVRGGLRKHHVGAAASGDIDSRSPLAAAPTPDRSRRKGSRKIGYALAAMVLGVLLLIPNTVRTYRLMGYPAPFGDVMIPRIYHRAGTRTFEIDHGRGTGKFGSASCHIQPLAPLSPWMIDRAYNQSTVCIKVGPTVGDRDEKRVYHELQVGWDEWFTRWAENIALFLFAPPWPDCYTGTWTAMVCYWSRWLWAPLIFFLVDANIRSFRARCFHLIPVATTIFLFALGLQNLTVMEGRYRKPLEPILLLNLVWVVRKREA